MQEALEESEMIKGDFL
jgi:hypothetical protein